MRTKLYCIVFSIANLIICKSVAQKTNIGIGNILDSNGSRHSIVTMTDNQLSVFNKVLPTQFIDTCNNKHGTPFKILVIGNSIAYHGKMEKIGWYYNRGMAATKIEKDYAHLIFEKVESIFPNRMVCMRIKNLANFERNYLTYDFAEIDSLVSFRADVIIFQLGENVKFNESNTSPLFKDKYIGLVGYVINNKSPIVIFTTPFFPSMGKNEIIEQVAVATGSYLVDLSHLDLDKQNYAMYEENYAGDKSVWKVDGIGRHPGDYGMKNIAEQIFITMNAALKNSYSIKRSAKE